MDKRPAQIGSGEPSRTCLDASRAGRCLSTEIHRVWCGRDEGVGQGQEAGEEGNVKQAIGKSERGVCRAWWPVTIG